MGTAGAVGQMNSGWAAWAEETVTSDCGESAAAADFSLPNSAKHLYQPLYFVSILFLLAQAAFSLYRYFLHLLVTAMYLS